MDGRTGYCGRDPAVIEKDAEVLLLEGARGTAGIPDIIACVDGRFVAFEVKTETGRLSRLQEVTLGRIRDAGGRAYMVRSAAEVAGILKEMGVAG